MTYLMQVQTTDSEIQLKTEVSASTVEELQYKATEMVKCNPVVVGMTYLVAKYNKKANGGFVSRTVKQGVIKG